jgi:hypothetical protein
MRKLLLLSTILAGLAMMPQPASAYGPVHPDLVPARGVQIILRQVPSAVRHDDYQRHDQPHHLYPLPTQRFGYRPQRWTWRGPWQPGPRHFNLGHYDHREWNRRPREWNYGNRGLRQHDVRHGHRQH